MLELNRLHRWILRIFQGMRLILRLFGFNTYPKRNNRQKLILMMVWQIYSLIMFNYVYIKYYIEDNQPIWTPQYRQTITRNVLCLLAYRHQVQNEQILLRWVRELCALFRQISELAQERNLLRGAHVVLCLLSLLGLAQAVRNCQIHSNILDQQSVYALIADYMNFMGLITLHIGAASILLLFIGLLACHEALHCCMQQRADDIAGCGLDEQQSTVEWVLLLADVRQALTQLLELRTRLSRLSHGLLSCFRVPLLLLLLHWHLQLSELFAARLQYSYATAVGALAADLLQLLLFFAVFAIFQWRVNLSTCIWHLQCWQYDKALSRDVDKFLQIEATEQVQVRIYGVHFDMRLFLRLLMLNTGYFFIQFWKLKLTTA